MQDLTLREVAAVLEVTVGESIDSYDADIVGDELDINFNHRYVSEGLQTIQSESTTLLFNGPGKPLVIRATDDTSFTYLVMPMNR
jgi:DNA polymerase-3 subunit beta